MSFPKWFGNGWEMSHMQILQNEDWPLKFHLNCQWELKELVSLLLWIVGPLLFYLFLGRNNGFLQNPTDRPNSHLEKIQNEQETLKTKSSPLLIADFFQFQILLKQKNRFLRVRMRSSSLSVMLCENLAKWAHLWNFCDETFF